MNPSRKNNFTFILKDFKSIKTVLLSLSFCLFLIFTLQAYSHPTGDWKKYSSQEGNCEIKFPVDYEITKEEKETTTTHKIQANEQDNIFHLAITQHQLELIDPLNLAQVSLDSFVSAVGGKIISEEPYKLKDHEGKAARIYIQESDVDVYYKVIIIGQIQYQLVVLDVTKNIEKEKEKFFKSFSITSN